MKTVTPRGTDYGAINIYLTDDPYTVQLGPTLRVPAMQGLDWELEVDEDELYGDEAKIDVYAKIQGVTVTVKHGQIHLDTLAAMVGSTVEELGVAPNQVTKTHIRPARPPYMRMRVYHAYTGNSSALLHTFTKVRLTSLTVKNVAKGYAEIEFVAKGVTAVYSHPLPSYLEAEAREQGVIIGDYLEYAPTRQLLNPWLPDDSQGFADRATGSGYIGQRAVASDTEGDYLEWTRPLGVGTAMLRIYGATASDGGRLAVHVDGQAVGEVDFYSGTPDPDAQKLFAFSVFATRSHTIRLESIAENGSSSGNKIELSSIELSSPNLTTLTNTLPHFGDSPTQIPASQYTDNDGTVTMVTPSGDGGELVRQSGIGDWIEYEANLSPGTYSVQAMLGEGDNYGALTVTVNAASLGSTDRYAALDALPSAVDIPGTFEVGSQQRVKIRFTTSSKNGSSSGYARDLGWIQVTPVTLSQEFLADPPQQSIVLFPWFADTITGWAGSADTTVQNWSYSGSGNDSMEWEKVALSPGKYRATLNAEFQVGGADINLQIDGQTVATFATEGSADLYARLAEEFELSAATLADITLDKPTGNATFSYLYLERI